MSGIIGPRAYGSLERFCCEMGIFITRLVGPPIGILVSMKGLFWR